MGGMAQGRRVEWMAAAGMAAAVVLAVGCANPAEEARQSLRAQAGIRATDDEARGLAIATSIAVLDQRDPRGEATSLRWQAAQNLGALGALEAYDVLWSRAFSPLSDKNPQVRRECVISLTRLPYPSSTDPRRVELVDKLRRRAAFERSETFYRQLIERDATVRMALVEGLITLGLPPGHGDNALASTGATGDRDCAGALSSLLSAFSSEAGDRVDITEIGTPTRFTPGLIETCIRGLAILTGTPESVAAEARRGKSLTDYAAWWSERIAAMPSVNW